MPGLTFQVSTASGCTDRRVSNEPLPQELTMAGVEAAVREAGYKMKRPLLRVLWGNLLEATETLPLGEAMGQCFCASTFALYFENKAAALFSK